MTTKSLIFGVCLIWIISEIVLARVRRSDSSNSQHDRASLRILWLTIILSITLGSIVSAVRAGDVQILGNRLPGWGVGLIIAGLIVRWGAILTLWKYFTVDVAITSGQRIVRSGPYRFVRHPAYSGSLLSFLGLGLVFANWLSLVSIVVPITAAFLYRIHVEERALVRFFGDEYVQYSATTKRLIPGIF